MNESYYYTWENEYQHEVLEPTMSARLATVRFLAYLIDQAEASVLLYRSIHKNAPDAREKRDEDLLNYCSMMEAVIGNFDTVFQFEDKVNGGEWQLYSRPFGAPDHAKARYVGPVTVTGRT